MARRQNRTRTRARPSKPAKASGGGGSSGGPKGGDAKPIKSMLLGMGLLALLAALGLVPIGGETVLNRFLGLFESADAPAAAAPAATAPTKPAGVTLQPKRNDKPMEQVTEQQEAELDDIINKKTRAQ